MHKLSETIERKFVDQIEMDEWLIETDTGYQPLTHINKTIEYEVWNLETEDGLELECADDHIVFRDNYEEVFVKNLQPGDKILTKNGSSIVSSIQRTSVSEHMYDVTVGDDNHRFYSNGILSHNTAAMAAYILWFAIFNPTKTTAVLANKMEQAQEIMDRIRMAFEYLPFFLQHGVKVYNKRRIEFDNGSIIFSSATSASSIRGKSVDLLYIDEAAFVENDLTFYESTYPVITAGESSRVIMTTTPRGARGMFYMLWRESQAGRNYYKTLEVIWDQHPKRDEKWKEVTIANIGHSRFAQEFACVGYSGIVTLQDRDFEFDISIGDAYKLLVDGNKFIVYEHISPSGKSYIGKTKKSIRERWNSHLRHIKNPTVPFHKAIKSYGEYAWTHRILSVFDTEEEALQSEIENILFRDKDNLYNMTNGGEGASGSVVVKDNKGNTLAVKIDDPRYVSGELVHIATGTIKARTISGNVVTVSINDPRLSSGELVSMHKGMKRSDHSKRKMSISAKARGSNTTGYKHSAETKQLWSSIRKGKPNNHNKKISDKDYIEILQNYDEHIPMVGVGVRCPKSGTIRSYDRAFCLYYGEKYGVTAKAIAAILKRRRILND